MYVIRYVHFNYTRSHLVNLTAADTVTNVETLPDYNLISSRRTLRQKLFSHDHSPLQTGTHLQPA